MIFEPKNELRYEIGDILVYSRSMSVISREEAVRLLSSDAPHTLALLEQARVLREKHFGQTVVLHVLSNAKSGRCSEDCGFCSQSARFETGIAEYPLLSDDELYEQARIANEARAEKFCIVTATRGPTGALLDRLCPSVTRIKDAFPRLKICTSLGLLNQESASRLRDSGVDRYNHNLESSRAFFPNIVSTHRWEERVETVQLAKDHGMEACCGGIVGLGESDADIIDLFFSLRDLDVDSIPVNLFNPRPGTPFGNVAPLSPMKGLRVLALARLINPAKDIRAAGGREAVLGHLQSLALFAVNSLFTNGYLTTTGQSFSQDEEMIREVGYEIVREGEETRMKYEG